MSLNLSDDLNLEPSIAALKWIARSIEMKNYAPTIREVGEGIGISSSSTAHKILKNLQQRGWVSYQPKIARSIFITDDGHAILEKFD